MSISKFINKKWILKDLCVDSNTQQNILIFKSMATERYPGRGFFYISYDYGSNKLDYFEVLNFDDYISKKISKKETVYKGTSRTILRKEKLKKIYEIQEK